MGLLATFPDAFGLQPLWGNASRSFWRLLKFQTRQFHPQSDPVVDQFPQPLVVSQLPPNHGQVFLPHKLTRALTVPGETHLVIRAMLLRRVGLAAAPRLATDVVLL